MESDVRGAAGPPDPMPVDAMTDEERAALAAKYRRDAEAHMKHAEELERYLAERLARDEKSRT